jgi:hypothetical protein
LYFFFQFCLLSHGLEAFVILFLGKRYMWYNLNCTEICKQFGRWMFKKRHRYPLVCAMWTKQQ